MANLNWRGGRNISMMQIRVKQVGESLKANAAAALEATLEEGGLYLQDNLEAATTKTGQRREAEDGGFPGRHLTGNMIASASWEMRQRRAKIIWGVIGWWGENFKQYFKDQDLGEGDIPAARALPQAMARARENLRRRLTDLTNGKRVS